MLRTQIVIKVFINPWTIANKENLYCISSGAPCPKNVEEQILNAEAKGTDIKEKSSNSDFRMNLAKINLIFF